VPGHDGGDCRALTNADHARSRARAADQSRLHIDLGLHKSITGREDFRACSRDKSPGSELCTHAGQRLFTVDGMFITYHLRGEDMDLITHWGRSQARGPGPGARAGVCRSANGARMAAQGTLCRRRRKAIDSWGSKAILIPPRISNQSGCRTALLEWRRSLSWLEQCGHKCCLQFGTTKAPASNQRRRRCNPDCKPL